LDLIFLLIAIKGGLADPFKLIPLAGAGET
jgi:hypothetical protein